MDKSTVDERTAIRYRNAGILDKWHNDEWDDFTNSPKAKKVALNYLKDPKEALEDGVGIFLWGANGVGKSKLMNLAFKDLLHRNYKVKIVSLSTLITKFTQGWYDGAERAQFNYILQNTDFLGIEEIGKEFKSSTDLGSVVLDSIIRYRVQMKKPVWATTNTKPDAITSLYTEDIASMLRECCIPLQVIGPDYRIKISDKISAKYL